MSDYEPGNGYPPGYPGPGVVDWAFNDLDIANSIPQHYGHIRTANFGSVSAPLTFTPDAVDGGFYITSPGQPLANGDTMFADAYVLTHNDDVFAFPPGFYGLEVFGSGGNDRLSSSSGQPGMLLDGGDGNDTLIANASGRDRLIGDAGNDTLFVSPGLGADDKGDKATGGSGADRFVFNPLTVPHEGGAVFIADFNPAQGDTIDLSSMLHQADYNYTSLQQAVAFGTIGVSYDHGYTYLSLDETHDGVPNHPLAYMKGVFLPSTFDHIVV